MTSRARQPAWLTAIGFTAVFLLVLWFVRYVLMGTLLEALLRGG